MDVLLPKQPIRYNTKCDADSPEITDLTQTAWVCDVFCMKTLWKSILELYEWTTSELSKRRRSRRNEGNEENVEEEAALSYPIKIHCSDADYTYSTQWTRFNQFLFSVSQTKTCNIPVFFWNKLVRIGNCDVITLFSAILTRQQENRSHHLRCAMPPMVPPQYPHTHTQTHTMR